MKKIALLSVFASLFFWHLRAQSLYMPRNIRDAFENGTRSMDGLPGPDYWQNRSVYHISLTVDPPDPVIRGAEQITYFNRSPDTLHSVVFRLLMNYHKPEAGRVAGRGGALDSTQLTRGILVDSFRINGKASGWPESTFDLTTLSAPLPRDLPPGDSVHFSIGWHYRITPEFSGDQATLREGMIDPTTWCVAYFYPAVAVYDDYNGWDELPFTGAQEFYNDFSDYTLSVRVPEDYIVWATGTLTNPGEVLQPRYAALLKKSMTADSVIRIVTPPELKKGSVTRQNPFNTWVFDAKDVTEVAVFLSNHDDWDAASVVVDTLTGRRASVQAAYYDTARNFHRAVSMGQKALGWLSVRLPGIPYPYPVMTAVEGFAGMEYPMMVNDDDGGTDASSLYDAMEEERHEISHSYFPFYMGINESRYAFMDEGWASTFALLMAEEHHRLPHIEQTAMARIIRETSDEDQVPMIESNYQTGIAYLDNAYAKPMRAYLALKDLLGTALFKKCLQGYIARWHGRHPVPWDFFHSFNDIAGKDLDWFWNDWFFSHGYDDLGIAAVQKTKDGYSVRIDNTGGFDFPFLLIVSYTDGTVDSLRESPALWENQPEHAAVPIRTSRTIRSLTVDNGIWLDANLKDNRWERGSR
jgi:hypothetical protein